MLKYLLIVYLHFCPQLNAVASCYPLLSFHAVPVIIFHIFCFIFLSFEHRCLSDLGFWHQTEKWDIEIYHLCVEYMEKISEFEWAVLIWPYPCAIEKHNIHCHVILPILPICKLCCCIMGFYKDSIFSENKIQLHIWFMECFICFNH